MTKFNVGDKAYKPKGYEFPCTIVGVFTTTKGDVRVVGEMDNYGLLHIFNENQLEHSEGVYIELPPYDDIDDDGNYIGTNPKYINRKYPY